MSALLRTDIPGARRVVVKVGSSSISGENAHKIGPIVDALSEGSRNGGLRLAGIVFLIVAVIGVLGLWWVFRRNQGPPWARNTRPPWAPKGSSKKPWSRSKPTDGQAQIPPRTSPRR